MIKIDTRRLRKTRRLFRENKRDTVLIILGNLVSSLTEGIGIVTIVAALGVFLEPEASSSSPAINFLLESLRKIGIEPSLVSMLVVALAAISTRFVFLTLSQSYAAYVRGKIEERERRNLIETVTKARWEFFISVPVGRFSNALNQEAGQISGVYAGLINLSALLLNVAVYFAAALALSWELALASLAVSSLLLFVFKKFVAITKRAGLNQASAYEQMSARFVDGLAGIKSLKAMGLDLLLGGVIGRQVSKLRRAQLKAQLAKMFVKNATEPLSAAIIVSGLIAAVTFLSVSAPVLIGMVLVFHRAVNAVGQVQRAYMSLVLIYPMLDRLWSLTDEAKRNNEILLVGDERDRIRVDQQIDLEDVSFEYQNGHVVLECVSITLKKGEITAISGLSGSGKTTIVDIICGLLRPTTGCVLIDGSSEVVNSIKWRQRVGYIQQDAFLFHDTIFANVSLGDPSLTSPDVELALDRSGAASFIQSLSDGIETVVGERGVALSGGQRQRIAIARALVRDPEVLILDEATTGLDPDTEAEVIATLEQLKKHLCIVVISHQQPLIQLADQRYHIKGRKVLKVPPVDSEPSTAVLSQ